MIYCILGPSGVGKTTIGTLLKNRDDIEISEIISTTTREMREGEVQDVSYHFVTEEEFRQLDLIEKVVYNFDNYGLQKEDVDKAIESGKDHFIILDRKGCVIMKRMFDNVRIIYMYAEPEELINRMQKRGDSTKKIFERLCNMIRDKELNNHDIANLIVTGDNAETIMSHVVTYIKNQ